MKTPSTAAIALLLATTLGAVDAGAQAFGYAPGTSRYKVATQQKVTQEAMGQSQSFDATGEQFISVEVSRKSNDTLAVTTVLDSLSMTHSMMGAMDMSSSKGATFKSLLAPTGVVYSITLPEAGAPGADLGDELGRFLPRVTGRLAAGATWTDTISGKSKQGGLDIDRTVIAKSRVVGDTTVGGQKAWKIERTSEVKMSGSGTAQGQPISMEGTSTGTGHIVVTSGGQFLASDSKDDVKMKITLISNGMEISQTMANASTVTRLP